MPLFNPPVTNNTLISSGGGISLTTNFYQIPPGSNTLVSEFYFDASQFSNIEIKGQANVLEAAEDLKIFLIKNNVIGTELASDTVNLASPTEFTLTLNGADTGTYQLMAISDTIGVVGNARIVYAVLNKT
jgi:hypothetical protein